MLIRLSLVVVVVVSLACGGTSVIADPTVPSAQAVDARVEIVQEVYNTYVSGRSTGLASLPLTDEMRASFDAMRDRRPMGLGFDPLIGGQDFELSELEVTVDDNGWVRASFNSFDVPMTVRWSFIEEAGEQRVTEIETPDGLLSVLLAP